MKNHSHTIITLGLLLPAYLFGWHWPAWLLLAGYWVGRELAQAEYRWLAANKANRSRMPWAARFLPESWNQDSLCNDLLWPLLLGGLLNLLLDQL